MPATTGQLTITSGRDGRIRSMGVAASTVLYEGTLCYLDANGFATDVKADANTVFLGLVRELSDNSGGVDGESTVEFYTDPTVRIDFTGDALDSSDSYQPAYGVDNATASNSATGNPRIGTIVEVISATRADVQLRGLGV